MSTLTWVVLAGLGMSALALVGSVTLVLPEATLKRIVIPLVAFAAGALFGGALFHMLPESIAVLGNRLPVFVSFAGGLPHSSCWSSGCDGIIAIGLREATSLSAI
ncbi:MAG TPA: hypothetical protein VF148_12870 [Acidimicrobiia bacterium]